MRYWAILPYEVATKTLLEKFDVVVGDGSVSQIRSLTLVEGDQITMKTGQKGTVVTTWVTGYEVEWDDTVDGDLLKDIQAGMDAYNAKHPGVIKDVNQLVIDTEVK